MDFLVQRNFFNAANVFLDVGRVGIICLMHWVFVANGDTLFYVSMLLMTTRTKMQHMLLTFVEKVLHKERYVVISHTSVST
jgi:hypothetical protein